MFKRLVLFSVLSVNFGYTFFLFPLLGILLPGSVPLTVYNLFAFMLVDSAWGVVLSTVIYLLVHLTGMSLARATMFSIASLWTIFWLVSLFSIGGVGAIALDHAVTVGIDGIAALITWLMLSRLAKHYIAEQ
ncbi:hypothetical protein DRO02_06550 [archaeon]|nr:MAG: hypothetical protein DRO02_06550 [archaeon]